MGLGFLFWFSLYSQSLELGLNPLSMMASAGLGNIVLSDMIELFKHVIYLLFFIGAVYLLPSWSAYMYVVGHEGLGFHDASSFQSFIIRAVLRTPLFVVQYHIIYYL
jgi:hypothetical protein